MNLIIRFLKVHCLIFGASILVNPSVSFSSAEETCQDVRLIESKASEREALLSDIRTELFRSANESIKSLRNSRDLYKFCDSLECQDFFNHFEKSLSDQMYLAKIIKAITKKNGILISRSYKDQSVSKVLYAIKNNTLRPDQIGVFDSKGFNYDNNDKKKAVQLWSYVFIKTLKELPQKSSFQSIRNQVTQNFNFFSHDLMALNPLLPFLTEADLTKKEKIVQAFSELIKFNYQFINQVQGFKIKHNNTLLSYVNLTNLDHEMALVNFPNQANQVIKKSAKNINDKTILCSAWEDLKKQQRIRIKASIGVGFGTALACTAGLWSGLATFPSLAICSPAIADGLWGARRGYLDAQAAVKAMHSGNQLLQNGSFTSSMLSPQNALQLQTQGQFVFMINMFGIIPVVKGVSLATKGTRGAVKDLFIIPGSDVLVSSLESKSANIAALILIIRGVEFVEQEFQVEIQRLTEIAIDNLPS